MIIHKKWSLPYHTYRISHQKLLSQICNVNKGVCNNQISLQYMIHILSEQAVANFLRAIQKILKKVQVFSWETITYRRWWLLMRHALYLQSLISLFLKAYLQIYLRNLVSRRCLIWQELCQKVNNLPTESLYLRVFWIYFWWSRAYQARQPLTVPLLLESHYWTFCVQEKNLPLALLELVDCQSHWADGGEKYGTFICNRFIEHMRKIDPHKSITDVLMFDGASNVQLTSEVLKINYWNMSVMCGVEHTVSLFFNDVTKIPVVTQIIISNKAMYNLFGSGVYH